MIFQLTLPFEEVIFKITDVNIFIFFVDHFSHHAMAIHFAILPCSVINYFVFAVIDCFNAGAFDDSFGKMAFVDEFVSLDQDTLTVEFAILEVASVVNVFIGERQLAFLVFDAVVEAVFEMTYEVCA